MKDKIRALKVVFKNWGEAKKTGAKLIYLSLGFAELAKIITENDLTPHSPETRVVFGSEHFNLANLAGAMGVYSHLNDTEEPLLAGGSPPEFIEPSVIEEKILIAKARVVEHRKTDDNGRVRKKFDAFIEVTNPEGGLKAIFELHYVAKPIALRAKEIAKIRARALAFHKTAH